MNKVAFFDFDGTLVAPIFETDGVRRIGFPPDVWATYTQENVNAYKDCVPIPAVVEYAEPLRSIGWDTQILTVIQDEGEEIAKANCIFNLELSTLFRILNCVRSREEKIEYILNYANKENILPGDCMLVEDDLNLLFDCTAQGIRTMHVSHIITQCYDASKES